MQHGPGTENAFGGVAQAYGDSVPIVVLPGGYPRRLTNIPPNFNAFLNFQHVTKWSEQVTLADAVPDAHAPRLHPGARTAARARSLVEIPADVYERGRAGAARLHADAAHAQRPRPARGRPRSPRVLVAAERPVIYAGQGVHYAKAWQQLRELAELLEAPVTTSLAGQERVPREPPAVARLGRPLDAASRSTTSCNNADVIFGIGCSFAHHQLRRHDAEGQDDHPRHARPGRPQQGRRRPSTRWSATPALTLRRADRRGAATG